MKLSTLTQRSEVAEAEQRHALSKPLAAVAAIAAVLLLAGGHWLLALGVLAVGGFLVASTAAELRSLGDPDSTERFYRLADPNRPLELPPPPADEP